MIPYVPSNSWKSLRGVSPEDLQSGMWGPDEINVSTDTSVER